VSQPFKMRFLMKWAAGVALAIAAVAVVAAVVLEAQAPAQNDPAARTGPDWVGADLSPRPPVTPLSVAEQQKRFVLQPGFRMEPVLTEPRIEQPGSIAFDGNGRMYVLELRTYMLDADSKDELAPTSRISRWEDRNNDGVYETGTTFVDGLIFPRFVTPLGDGVILTKESNAGEVWMYSDTNNDGVADKKELFTTDFGRSANVEHQEAELTWLMDNWMYATRNAIRLRWTPNGARREPIGNPGGSWGITQDDDGRMFSQGGASGLPGYFQFPVHYGAFDLPNQLDPGLRVPYGAAIKIADMQGGMDSVRMPDGSLNGTTAGAGADVFRGHRLPADLLGDYFYGEVVARIVRRVEVTKNEGLTRLSNFYEGEKSEFLKSSDPLFRPVGLQTAPDGTMYVVDMYHGIIQEGQWTQRGTYLRARIEQYQLDKVVNLGRIWRLSHESMPRDTTVPRMFQETSAQLVAHLSHPNGWWRDMAQQVLVMRQDKSVAPALRTMARSAPPSPPEAASASLAGGGNEVARMHALWTLEGIGALDAPLVREAMADSRPRIRVQALRVSESLYKAGDKSFAADYKRLASDPDADVAAHALLTLNVLKVPDAAATIRQVAAMSTSAGVAHVSRLILSAPPDTGAGGNTTVNRTTGEMALLGRGLSVFGSLCSECHGNTGAGTPAGDGLIAPPLAGNARVTAHPEYVIKTLLHGQTGPVAGRSYAGGLMVPFGSESDEWIASLASYVRTNLTNNAFTVTPEMVARVRAATASRKTPWTNDELMASVPTLLAPQANWKVTASHRAPSRIGMTGEPAGAFDFEGWTTGVPQTEGMWWQLELPAAANLAEMHFYSPNGGGGGGGRGGVNAPPPQTTAPRAYRVQLSMDGVNWAPAVAEGRADGNMTALSWTPTMARFLRITQTVTTPGAPAWSMLETKIYTRAR
jgi:mono/diheme cytochrome c family protein/glucose/arabinose dehydrogenase